MKTLDKIMVIINTSMMPLITYSFVCIFERQAQNETKKQNHSLIERVQALQAELQDSEVRRNELEGQVRQSHTVS